MYRLYMATFCPYVILFIIPLDDYVCLWFIFYRFFIVYLYVGLDHLIYEFSIVHVSNNNPVKNLKPMTNALCHIIFNKTKKTMSSSDETKISGIYVGGQHACSMCIELIKRTPLSTNNSTNQGIFNSYTLKNISIFLTWNSTG